MRTHRGKPQHRTSSVADNLPGLPATAPNPRRATGAGLSPSARWQQERARILARNFERIEHQVAAGRFVRPLIRRMARCWSGKVYASAPARAVRLSPGRLLNLYYGWVRSGRSRTSLQLRYAPRAACFTLTDAQQQRLSTAFKKATTFAELHVTTMRGAKGKPSVSAFIRRCFTQREHRHLARVFSARRAQRSLERRFSLWQSEPTRTFRTGGAR